MATDIVDGKAFVERIYGEWQHFVAGRPVDPAVVRPDVEEAWKRCARLGVDPYGGECKKILEGPELEALLRKNEEIIGVSRRFLNDLYSFLRGYGFYVMLTDARCAILEFFGEDVMQKAAHRQHFKKGAYWDEENVGSTTMGTIMHTRKPSQMTGAEHYCAKNHVWTCSAAPILDDEGTLLGIINVSGPREQAHRHTFGMVCAAAESVCYLLRIRKQNAALLRTNRMLGRFFEAVSEPLMLLDSSLRITRINAAGSRVLGGDALVGIDFQDVLATDVETRRKLIAGGFHFNDMELGIRSGGSEAVCLVSCTPMDVDGNGGRIVTFRPMEGVQRLVGRYGGPQARLSFGNIVTADAGMRAVIEEAKKAARGEGSIILEGESGTGKEIFAQAIHNGSRRRPGPFVAVNCGAIPREFIGSELFGYVAGAFTGAAKGGRPGKFELAAGGTLFLDEIGDMPLEQQVALLRVLQERKLIRIGGEKEIPVDARIICATNKSLKHLVRTGAFRADLFYRLNVISIRIPPLRERPEDIGPLFTYFMDRLCAGGLYARRILGDDFLAALGAYEWPGNVRELQNIVERVMNVSAEPVLTVEHLPDEILSAPAAAARPGPALTPFLPQSCRPARDDMPLVDSIRSRQREARDADERQKLATLLDDCRGNLTDVARRMGLSRNTLYRKLKKHGMRA